MQILLGKNAPLLMLDLAPFGQSKPQVVGKLLQLSQTYLSKFEVQVMASTKNPRAEKLLSQSILTIQPLKLPSLLMKHSKYSGKKKGRPSRKRLENE